MERILAEDIVDDEVLAQSEYAYRSLELLVA
jgi:hypothetical protein